MIMIITRNASEMYWDRDSKPENVEQYYNAEQSASGEITLTTDEREEFEADESVELESDVLSVELFEKLRAWVVKMDPCPFVHDDAVSTNPFPSLRRCGLNADWCWQAWHLGPGCEPNLTSGDFYILENEDEKCFSVVQRFYEDDGNDRVDEIGHFQTPAAALEAGRARIAELIRPSADVRTLGRLLR